MTRIDGRTTHPLYSVWHGMMGRCYLPSVNKFECYGGRGIKVCDSWHQFWPFIEDMGPRPSGHFLDRKDNDLDYMPSNCRWATKEVHHNNKRCSVYFEWNGERLTVAQWCRRLDLCPQTVVRRMRMGWPVELVLSQKSFQGTRKYGASRK